jgi:outer membrane receptor protein involved in Fe transport
MRSVLNPCRLALVLGVLVLAAVPVLAQTTGKIAGKVTDARTGEPLTGANVIVQGSTMGAASDVDGEFFIINIPPGIYNVRVRMVGYESQLLENIAISVNRTTDLAVKLRESIVEGQEVVITAEKVVQKKDQTSSVRNVTSEQMKALPVENLSAVVEMQAGVVQGHFRGGRLDEVSYMVDGLGVDESFGRGRGATVEKEVVAELEVITGTFNAEYGNAMSGIVNAVTKDGGNAFHGSVAAAMGNYLTGHSDIFTGLKNSDWHRNQDYKAFLSGPIVPDLLTFVVNSRYQDNKGYLNGIRRFMPDNYSTFEGQDPTAWYSEHTGDNASVAMNWDKSYSVFGKISLAPAPLVRSSVILNLNNSENQSYAHDWKYNPDGRGTGFNRSTLLAWQLNHSISQAIFYEAKVSFLTTSSKYYVFESPFDNGYVHDEYQRDDGSGFLTGGNEKTHNVRETRDLSLKLDGSWQINRNHIVKAGGLFTRHDLNTDFTSIRNLYYSKDYVLNYVYDSLAQKRRYLYYQPTLMPDSSVYTDRYRVYPIELAAYIQDKMEFEDMVINVGLRYDYFNPKTTYPTQPRNPSNQLSFPDNPEKMSEFPAAPAVWQLSPRFGISYKLGSSALLRFAYGHFFQMPPLYALYQNYKRLVPPTDFSTTLGNTQLKPQKTIQYEVGLWQQLMPGMSLEVAVFYRDIYDLLSARVITTYNQIRYGLYSNKDYGNARGLEVKYEFYEGAVSASINYTLQYTRGNADNPTFTFTRAGQSMDPVNILIPMSWDQRHTLNVTVGYATEDLGGTITGYYNSGTPYTWTPIVESSLSRVNLFPNNSPKPGQFMLDLRAFYTLYSFSDVRVRATLLAHNLLDNLNEVSVNSTTGRAYSAIVRESEVMAHHSNYNDYYDRIHDPSMYSSPREVKIGLEVLF